MKSKMECALLVVAVMCLLQSHVVDAQLVSCSEQRPCLTIQENACVGGSRTVCLGVNPANPGCSLTPGVNNVNQLCALVNSLPQNTLTESNGPVCGIFAGGSTAMFAVLDGTAAGTLSGAAVFVQGSTTNTRTGSCAAEQTARCLNAPASNTNNIWTFPVTSCTCNCDAWSEWSTCSSSCTRSRTRSCRPPSSDVACTSQETETSTCTGGSCLGCSCSPTWSTWSACSSTCQGAQQMRTRTCVAVASGTTCETITETKACASTATCADMRFRCHCGGWTGWSSCSSSCSTGSQSRTRSCAPIPGSPPPGMCPSDVFPTTMTASCMGRLKACPATTPKPPTGCSCNEWSHWGGCSRTCGGGTQSRSRTCTSQCPTSMSKTEARTCATNACPNKPITGCVCTAWKQHTCSVTCGGGTAIEYRTCPKSCPSNTLEGRIADCNTQSCDVGFHDGFSGGRRGGRRRGGGGRRGGRRRGCDRFRNRNQRRRCRRRNEE